jgi:sodium/proline symporter
MAIRDGTQAIRQARLIALGWSVIVFTGMLLLGFCGRLILPGLLDGEQVFVEATNALFSPVVAGVMIAAVLSAIMSTADSQLLVASSSVTQDLGLGGNNQRSMLLRSRLVVLILSAGAVIAAVINDESIFNQVLFAWGAMGAAFGPLLIVTVLRGPVSPTRTLLAMVLGCTTSVIAYRWGLQDSDKYIERVVPYVLAFAVILCPTPAGRRSD